MQNSCQLQCFFWTFYILYHGVIVNSSFQGKEFLLAFPSSFPTNSYFEQRLSIANSGDLEASINITMSKNSTVLLFHQKTLGVGQGCFGDCINESLSSTQSRLGGVVIRIISTSRIVVIAHSTSAGSEYDNFIALPAANLSLAYSALAECPGSFCVLIVASAARAVNITITFCLASSATPASLKYNNITYFHGSNMTATLDPWQTLEIVTDGVSLGGSLIQSSGKIAVVSGTLTLSNGAISDFNVDAAVPRDQLGTEYVVVDCPTCGTTTFVKILYIEPNTNLSIDTKMLVLNTRRDCIEFYIVKNQGAAIIRSDKPILVQLMYSNDDMIVAPTMNWGTYYVTVPSSQSRVVLVTRSNCSSDFSFNGLVDNKLSWSLIGDGSFKYATTSMGNYGTWLNVSAMNCTFTGIVYSSTKATMLWSLGWGPDFVPPVTNSLTTTSSYNAGVTQTSTSSLVKDIVDTTPAAVTTSLTTACTSTDTALITSSTTASTTTETLSPISSTTTLSPTSLPTSSTTTPSPTSLPTSSTTTSSPSSSPTYSTTTSSPTSSPTSSTTTSSPTSSPTFSTTTSSPTSSPTFSTTTSSSTSSPTFSTTTSSSTSSPTYSTTTSSPTSAAASTSTETSPPTSSTTASIATSPATASTTETKSATKTSSPTAASPDTAIASSSTSFITATIPTLSTPMAQPAEPTTVFATTINPPIPLPDLYVCPCTCSYASFHPLLKKLLHQKENIVRDFIVDLKLVASAQSAQKMLKISTENQSMSETIVGATIFILFMAISVSVMVGPDLLRMASYIIRLFRTVAQNFK